ncbi:MAG: TonB dep Rec protein, partial [Acidobacteria bacterium]|nr:TonB dep Rec protein [Acidobacteriota bacterium]
MRVAVGPGRKGRGDMRRAAPEIQREGRGVRRGTVHRSLARGVRQKRLATSRGLCRDIKGRVHGWLLVFACCAAAAPAGAQRPPPDIGPLTSTLDLGALRDLPSTGNLFSLLETTQPEVISDRFFGGVNPAESARLGVFLASWTQTTFLVDGVDV